MASKGMGDIRSGLEEACEPMEEKAQDKEYAVYGISLQSPCSFFNFSPDFSTLNKTFITFTLQ